MDGGSIVNSKMQTFSYVFECLSSMSSMSSSYISKAVHLHIFSSCNELLYRTYQSTIYLNLYFIVIVFKLCCGSNTWEDVIQAPDEA